METAIQDIKTTKAAEKDYKKLEKNYRDLLDKEYKTIIKQGSTKGIYIKHLKNEIFEIITGDLRSLFAFENGDLIVIAVIFIKKSQKTPKHLIERALNIIKKWEKENDK